MTHANALSRNPLPISLEVTQINLTEGDWILAAQLQDEQFSRIRTILLENESMHETKHYFEEYVLKDVTVRRSRSDIRSGSG